MPTNFLWNAGASSNGLLISPLTLMTIELQSIANGAVIVSSVGGTSGVFTNASTGQGVLASLFLYVGNPSITTTAGANWSGWFLESLDGGTTYESATILPARAPDFYIPIFVGATSIANPYKTTGPVTLPALQFKVLVQNNMGVTSSGGGTTAPYLKAAPFAMQY